MLPTFKEFPFSLKCMVIFLAILIFCFAYISIEPIIYAYTGFGFYWEYNPDYIPLIKR
jgi:hypothetical protein